MLIIKYINIVMDLEKGIANSTGTPQGIHARFGSMLGVSCCYFATTTLPSQELKQKATH